MQAALDRIRACGLAWPLVVAALREMDAAGVEIDEAAVSIAVKLGEKRWRTGCENWQPRPSASSAKGPAIVYYVRRGDLIKIGTTIDPSSRFRALLPDEILAAEPGGTCEESVRHRQFKHLRRGGEYFRTAPELTAHIAWVRDTHGDPDPSWPTFTGGGLAEDQGSLYTRSQVKQLCPGCGRGFLCVRGCALDVVARHFTEDGRPLLPAAALAEVYGIKARTIYQWERRGYLAARGLDEDGRRLYDAGEVGRVKNRPRRREPAQVFPVAA